MVGLTYNSGTLLAPGHVRHSGIGMTVVGELDGSVSPRLEAAVAAFRRAGIETTASPRIVDEIWKKLALNVCTLPTAALLRFPAHELIEHPEMLELMRGLLAEVAAVARPQGIDLDEGERWTAIVGLLEKAVGARASMLQDVEAGRRTEIDVVNGAIVDAGRRHSIPTPLNDEWSGWSRACKRNIWRRQSRTEEKSLRDWAEPDQNPLSRSRGRGLA